jgi:5-methylthioadenosine/S-adenosylhomocysteine deaminase
MPKVDILINGCEVLLPDNGVLHDGVIVINGGKITQIMEKSSFDPSTVGVMTIDGQGKLAIPGLIDAHTHAAQTLLRGSVIDEPPMIWARILVPFESSIIPEDVYAGAMLFCLENIKAGITTFAEAGGPHMTEVCQAAIETGIRAVITRSTMDQGAFIPDSMKDTAEEAIKKIEALYEAYHGAANDRIRVWFGLRQVLTTSPALAEATAARTKALNTGVHTHLAEHFDEVSHCLANFRMRPAEWFDHFNLLGPNFIGAHAVKLSEGEIELLRERKASAVHCPVSNLRSHGFSKTPLMVNRGVNIGLGTDGASGNRLDLFEQMRLLKNAMQARYGIEINDPVALPLMEVFKMATMGGARAVMQEKEIGSLEVGKKADVVLLSLNSLHMTPTADLAKTMVATAGASDINDVIIDGKLLLKDRKFLHFDEDEIRIKAGESLLRAGKMAGLRMPSVYTS